MARARTEADRHEKHFAEVVPQILAAASSVRQAHSDLRAAVYASNFTAEDVNEYLARVQRLVELYKTLRP